MTIDVLIRFLNADLIDVKGDDAKFEKLQGTSADLSALLKKEPSKSVSFALIAFDPSSSEDDPVIQEAVAALQKRWATYSNTFSGTPVTVIRAILLDALSKAAADDVHIGIAFVSSARNVLPFIEAGNESKIWGDVVTEIEKQVNVLAEGEWATPESIHIPEMNYLVPAAIEICTQQTEIDAESLIPMIAAASGPQSGNQSTGGNPYWAHSQPQQWVGEFSSRMATTIGNALEMVLEGTQIPPIDLSAPLKNLANTVSAHIDETLKAVSGATAGLQRRTGLIWWKETLYSQSAQSSYRDMSPSIAAALMAFDLHQQIPIFSPASVAAFLHETVLNLLSSETQDSNTIRVLLEEALQANELASLRNASAQLVSAPTGRGPLLGILGHGFGQSLNDEQFRNLVGIPADSVLTVSQWATWVFRELQAARAIQEGTGTKKRGRKS